MSETRSLVERLRERSFDACEKFEKNRGEYYSDICRTCARTYDAHLKREAADQIVADAERIQALRIQALQAKVETYKLAFGLLREEAPREPAGVTPQSEILAWLNLEQRKAERWGYSTTGVYRFCLTGPELMRIRHALGTIDGEWQCRFVAVDKRCCQLSKGHYGEHQFEEAATGIASSGDAETTKE